jgi:hypothetical protein
VRAQSQAGPDIYTDGPASGWQSVASNTTTVLDGSGQHHDGTTSLSITYTVTQTTGMITLKTSSPLPWNAYDVIRFWIHGDSLTTTQLAAGRSPV